MVILWELALQVPVQAAAWDAEGLDSALAFAEALSRCVWPKAWRRATAAEALRRHQAPTCGCGLIAPATTVPPQDALDNTLDTNLALVQDPAQENRARSPSPTWSRTTETLHASCPLPMAVGLVVVVLLWGRWWPSWWWLWQQQQQEQEEEEEE